MNAKWNDRTIELLDIKRIDNATVKTGDVRLQLIGVDLTFDILTIDKEALRLLDCASAEIIRCTSQPFDLKAVFKAYPGAVSPFGWQRESFRRGGWAEYPCPDHAWYNDIAECEIRITDRIRFRALVSVRDTNAKQREDAARGREIRNLTKASHEESTPEKPDEITLNERLLFYIAQECPKLDEEIRRGRRAISPSHWGVFLAAWKERLTPYDMERKYKWPRKTAHNRLTTVQDRLLKGEKVKHYWYDSGTHDSVSQQIEAARKHGAEINKKSLSE